MIFIFILLIFLLFVPLPKIALAQKDVGGEDYMSVSSALPIKGFFVGMIIMSHFVGLGGDLTLWYDATYVKINGFVGQLMVAPFLFYSGFGIFESVRKKGRDYVNKFLKNRFFVTWLSFAICLLFFLVENAIMAKKHSLGTILLSFTGWTSIGNSNWFMFVTFSLYILFFAVYLFGEKKDGVLRLAAFTVLCVIEVYILKKTRDAWWWNTLYCFPCGMWYGKFKEKIDKVLFKNKLCQISMILLSVAAFCGLYFLYTKVNYRYYIFYSAVFPIMIVFISSAVRFRGKILSFLGNHIFSVYILQRIWFYAFAGVFPNKYLYFAVCVCLTVSSAVLYDMLFAKLKRRIVNGKN